MKYGNTFFMQLNREICQEEYKHLSLGAKWLFVIIKENEQKFCGENKHWFFRSDEDMANDMGVPIRSFYRYKDELSKTDLVRIGYSHYISDDGKLSKKKVTNYTVLV